jgi:hypothetical protein
MSFVTKTTTTCYKHNNILKLLKTKLDNAHSEFMNSSDNISNNEFGNAGTILQEMQCIYSGEKQTTVGFLTFCYLVPAVFNNVVYNNETQVTYGNKSSAGQV